MEKLFKYILTFVCSTDKGSFFHVLTNQNNPSLVLYSKMKHYE